MDPYQILGVTRDCAPKELKEAFRCKALLAHPDRGGEASAFIQLRDAYHQITADLKRRRPKANAGSPGHATRTDGRSQQPDPNWEPDLIVLDEPLHRVRPARAADPNWEPDLIVRDEPLPRIRPARPPDPSWEPDLILGDEEAGNGASPGPGAGRAPYPGWLPGVSDRTEPESPASFGTWLAVGGAAAISFAVTLTIWMFWPSTNYKPLTKPPDLTPLNSPNSLPGIGRLPFSDWPDSSSGTKLLPIPERPDSPSELVPWPRPL
jgi:DnaJ domain